MHETNRTQYTATSQCQNQNRSSRAAATTNSPITTRKVAPFKLFNAIRGSIPVSWQGGEGRLPSTSLHSYTGNVLQSQTRTSARWPCTGSRKATVTGCAATASLHGGGLHTDQRSVHHDARSGVHPIPGIRVIQVLTWSTSHRHGPQNYLRRTLDAWINIPRKPEHAAGAYERIECLLARH